MWIWVGGRRSEGVRYGWPATCRAVVLALGLGGPAAAAAETPRPFPVVTTFTVIQDIAQNVAGDAARVEAITRPGAEIHDYQPTPKDIVRASRARLILWNGLNLERWFERFLGNVDGVASAIVSAGVTPLAIREGPYRDNPNPHAWMSPTNALIYVENIKAALSVNDPGNAATYARNASAYAAKIKAIDAPLRHRLASIPQAQRWLVTSEGAFSYLARDYGFKELYLWPINADEQGTPSQVRRVIDMMRRERIPVIFSESTISDRSARQVAKETGARYGGVLYVDSLSGSDGPVPTYLKLLEVTVDTIARGFGQ